MNVTSVINTILEIVGIISLVMILMGGFSWMTAGGRDTQASNAKKLLFIGLFVLILTVVAYFVSALVLNQIPY